MFYQHPALLPRSKAFVGLEWTGERIIPSRAGVRGDTYPVTWAADDQLYVGTGDPCWAELDGRVLCEKDAGYPNEEWRQQRISGQVFEQLTGQPASFGVKRIHDMPGFVGWGGSGPKPSGLISVSGKLYYAVQNLLGWKPHRYGVHSQHGSDATILCSDDFGRSWTPDLNDLLYSFYQADHIPGQLHGWRTPAEQRVEAKGFVPMFPGNLFGGPSFVQFGRDNQAAVNDYVYAVSADGWDNGTELRLGRVPSSAIIQRAAWEFAVPDDNGGVTWTDNLYQSKPILAIHRHVSLPEMIYLPGEGKYLLLTWSLHREFAPQHGSQLTVLEADQPWGPFNLVYYEWMWHSRKTCCYCPRIPLKWFDFDRLEGYMLHSGNWEERGEYYLPALLPFKLLRG